MTTFFIRIYRYFRNHRAVYWTSLVALFVFFGYFASQIHLEEDINKLMPSSRNPDGSVKLAFSNLRIKDKTFILFQSKKGADVEYISKVEDAFVDSLESRNAQLGKGKSLIHDVFYTVTDDDFANGIDYMEQHFPAYIDPAIYKGIDTLLTPGHMYRQMKQNAEDMEGSFGENFPELIQMDPIGMREQIVKQMAPMLKGSGSGYSIVNDHIFVPDSTVGIAFLTPQASGTNTGNTTQLFEILNEEIDSFAATHPDVKISYHGTPASGYYNSHTIKKDLTTTIFGSFIIVLVFIFICFRNWDTLPLLILPVVFGTIFGLALMYFIKGEFSLLALGIGAIVLGVAMSYVLHVLTHYKYVNDPEQVLRDEAKPVMLGCITTVGSFMGLIFIDTELLKDFGLFATFAIVGTTLFSLTYLPQLLDTKKNRINKKAFALIDKINNYPFDRKKPLLAVITVVTVIAIVAYLIGGTNFDSNMDNLGYKAPETTYSSNLLAEKTKSDMESTYFASIGKTMEEAIDNFAPLAARLDTLKAKGLVRNYTPTDKIFISLKKQQHNINAWKQFWNTKRLAKVNSLIDMTAGDAGFEDDAFKPFFERAKADYEPDKLYEADVVPAGYLSTMMEKTYDGKYLVFTSVSYDKKTKEDRNGAYYKICDAISGNPNMLILDTTYYTTDNLLKLNSDFNVLQWISMAFVFLVLLFSFRFNWKYTLLGFMPIILSWLITLGAMNIFGMQFNLINIIISTFIFGIGVDYSIFVMNGLIGGEKDSHLLAYHKTAIFFSAFILVVTASSMLLATHPAIKSVGFSTLVGLLSAVVLSYVLQPAIFRWMKEGK